jgi:outer membrane protein insertion porin family
MSLAKSAHAMASISIRLRKLPLIAVPLFTIAAHDLSAQPPTNTSSESPSSVCGLPIPAPAKLPPADSGPIVYVLIPCFDKQGGASVVEAQTYLYYMNVRPSLPSQDKWVPYDSSTEQTLKEDFKRLWATSFLDDLTIEVKDYHFTNGVIGKIVIYHMEERQRVKIVDFVGSKELEQTKIDEKLREENVQVRMDSFINDASIRRTKAIIRSMLSEKGYLDSTVTHEVKPMPAQGTKTVHLTFNIEEGPKYVVHDIDFVGNKAVGDRSLKRRMKETKEKWIFSFVTGRGTYKDSKYEEDAEKVQGFYRDKGYLTTTVGNPEIRTLKTSEDGKKRDIQLVIPVSEGARYKVGTFGFADNKVVKSEALKPIFKLKEGEYYSEKTVRKGLEKAREVYGSGGYWEMTGYPMFKRQDEVDPNASAEERAAAAAKPAVVDITMHMQEGDQFFVNRINFTGNTVTRDRVIRREINLVEGGVFNTEALKYSVKRLNQLGYFKPLEGNEAIQVQKAASGKNQVDVTLKLEEQNRNQLQFGAGYSQLDGTFMSGSYATSNFLGQGETFEVAAQVGARAKNYQFSVTEPYLFDRPISGGITLFSRKYDYMYGYDQVFYSEVRAGISVTGGMPLRMISPFARIFTSYAYEVIDTAFDEDLLDSASGGNPGDPVFGSLDRGRHIESRVSPTVVYNTVDNPFAPRSGMRITGTFEVAGGMLGGTTDYIRPDAEVILYIPHTRRTAFGLRAQGGLVRQYGGTDNLPYYRRFFLGGETQVRGYDIRTVGPLDSQRRALGGDKFLLFNAEYYFDIASMVRALVFHDAGQAYAEGDPFNLRTLRTSSGVEMRVMMPVMNVPLRFIYAWNLYRDTFQPARTFKFAVGTTF